MKKLNPFLYLGLIILFSWSCKHSAGDGIKVEITNPTTTSFTDVCITLNDPALMQKIDSLYGEKFMVSANDSIIPHQRNDWNKDGATDDIIVLCNLEANQNQSLTILKATQLPAFPKRTQAEISIKTDGAWKDVKQKNGKMRLVYEGGSFKNIDFLRVPDQHTDHSFFIRYEGPGWESDKVGYRFYLDWRNATDVFGKKTSEMVLQNVGQDGFESYHEPADWGMDVLKVGKALGIGSIAYWIADTAGRVATTDSVTCQIAANDNLQSTIITNYYGWQVGGKSVNLIADFSIQAGSRLTKAQLSLSDKLDNLCTGIVKLDSSEVIVPATDPEGWTYFATFGKQSLAGDCLGMVVFYRNADLIEKTEDAYSHVVVLKPTANKLTYYFAATWEQDKDGIKTKEDFIKYLETTALLLNTNFEIKY